MNIIKCLLKLKNVGSEFFFWLEFFAILINECFYIQLGCIKDINSHSIYIYNDIIDF